MRESIMFYPSIAVLVGDAIVLGFLIYAWFRDNRRYKDE